MPGAQRTAHLNNVNMGTWTSNMNSNTHKCQQLLTLPFTVNNQNTSGANNRQTQPGTTNNLLISDLNNKASVPAAPSVSHKSPSLPNGVGVQQAPTAVPSLSDGGTSSSNSNNNDNVVLGPDQTTTTTTTMTRTSGNNFGENYLGQQQQQQQQQQQASVIQQQQQHRFCPPQFSSRNLVWNMTRAGQVTRQACPEGSTGRVSWLCDYERLRFQPLLAPDFSECRSNWLTRLSQQLDQMLELPSSMKQQQQSMLSSETLRHQDEQMIKSVLGELSLMARTKELFSEDLKRIDIMIGQMIAQLKSMSVLFGSSQHLQQQPAVASTLPNNRLVSMYEDLFVKLTNVISSLFDMSQRNAWFELPSFEIRRRLELRLLNHLRDAALMMAQSLPIEQLAEMPPVRQTNILAGISVIPNADSSSQSNRVGVPLDGTTGELNLASSKQQSLLSSSAYGSQLNRLFATTTTTSSSTADSADDQQAELRLQATLLKELAANGINKFVILDIKKPDYSLMRQQLEQQQQAAYSSSLQQNELIGGGGAQQSGSLDSSQNLAGDLAQYQSRIFGIFPTIGDTGEYFDVSHQHQATTTAVDSGSKPELRRLAEMLIQSPLSVEFKLAPTNGAVANSYNNNQPMRQCQSLSSDISAPTDPQLTTTTAIAPRCHLSKFNSTNFVCLCDTFGFVSLTQQLVQPNPSLQSGFQLLQNDRFQWPNSVPGSSSYDSNNQIDPQLDPRLYDQTAYVVNKQQQLQQQQQPQTYFGILTSIFVVIGLGLLIVSIGGLVVSLGIRLTSQARLSKKQKQSFFESLNGPTTGPLTDHNLLGSDPLVSSAATTHSASIIGLNTGASGQTCSTTTTTAAAAGANIQGTGVSDYKAHQQFYAHHPHTSPMLDAYGPSTLTTGQASGRWPARLAGWLLRRPTSWLSNQLSSNAHRNHHHHQHQVDGPLCGKAVDQMIQHRLIGGTGSTTLLNQHANGSMLAYHHQQHHHKSPYQNGYTTSLGLQHQIQHQHHHHHHQTRGQISSTGSHSGVPLNSSSNSSYVSSSAYYEEIGPGNLTKMNPSRPTTAAPASGNLVDSFKRHPHNQDPGHQQLALMANTNQAGTANNQHLHQQHLHHQHMQQQQQQQYPHNQWQPVGGNGMISYHQTEAHTALAQSVQQVQANQKQQQQPQQVSMITKQHLHNDLSPLQSSSSSSAGSQHSASLATNVTTATGNASSGNGATTPRHYLFASPSAVTAYKQQQQNFRG